MKNQTDGNFNLLDVQDELSKLTTQLAALLNVVTTDGVVEQLHQDIICNSLWIARDINEQLVKTHDLLFDSMRQQGPRIENSTSTQAKVE